MISSIVIGMGIALLVALVLLGVAVWWMLGWWDHEARFCILVPLLLLAAGPALAGNHSGDESADGMARAACNCSGFKGVIAGNVVKMLSPGGFSRNEPGMRERSFPGDHGMLGHI